MLLSVRGREPSVTDREPSVTGRGFRSVCFFTVRCRAVFSTYSFPAQFPVSSVLFSGPGVGAFDSSPWRILFVGNVHILTNCSVRLGWEHDAASRALPKTVSPALLTFISSSLLKISTNCRSKCSCLRAVPQNGDCCSADYGDAIRHSYGTDVRCSLCIYTDCSHLCWLHSPKLCIRSSKPDRCRTEAKMSRNKMRYLAR